MHHYPYLAASQVWLKAEFVFLNTNSALSDTESTTVHLLQRIWRYEFSVNIFIGIGNRVKKSENKFEIMVDQLLELSNHLPLEVVDSWTYSSYNIARYLHEHADNGAGLDVKSSALMAAGRLDLLLRETRLTLGGLFVSADILTLVNCYQGHIFSPTEIHGIESVVCDDLGIELEDYQSSSVAALIDKLRSLSSVQRLALVDALEQFWYRGILLETTELREFFASLEIRLG